MSDIKLTEYEIKLLRILKRRPAPSRYAGKNSIVLTAGMQRLEAKGMAHCIYAGYCISDEGEAWINAHDSQSDPAPATP